MTTRLPPDGADVIEAGLAVDVFDFDMGTWHVDHCWLRERSRSEEWDASRGTPGVA